MFKFGFSRDDDEPELNEDEKQPVINWIPASKVDVIPSLIEKFYEPHDYIENMVFPGCKLKLIRTEKALLDLKEENCLNILEAESQHSDLVPAKYEGGLKVWECSYDLARYINEEHIEFKDKIVLDLGCGAGIIGLVALKNDSIVHFQDYNVEVINAVTIPNVLLNFDDRVEALKKCDFYSGDWESFRKLPDRENEVKSYDLIFTSETIYNPENHKKLYDVFKERLKETGVGFIAGKSYYFGVGGGMRQFQSLIEEDGCFNVRVVWKSQEGLQREILKVTRKRIS